METEQLAIFSPTMERIGVRTRAEVHAQGYWHETFHCWFLQEVASKRYILFQQRASQKKDFPDRLDITAAGHLLATETAADGVREIQEELGLDLALADLVPAGIVPDPILIQQFQDREFCHLFFYQIPVPITNLVLQREEVAGIAYVEFTDFEHLLRAQIETVTAQVYLTEPHDPQKIITRHFKLADFCPHSAHYYETVLSAGSAIFERRQSGTQISKFLSES
ncbi:NUDIX hydrolase [Dictyobacter kobayashii]|uniref:Putative Nudix hydrolase n=1 Tax=Dictyobacter kobayashii TaxID=2014872 RepID=A0A402AWU5_9CHLR|nr:NUDIX domain-containing protein [Dictyobacter kobayashii]GCE23524.1 putative Nudix hydrolase [Dictyobacter kobayashii]